jgi:hypothetical protein
VISTAPPRGSRAARICAVVVTAASLGAAGPVAGSSGDPTAAASKKKCKKALWKCAPKRYHLSATDTIGPGSQSAGFVENWTAEVDLVRARRNIGHVDYGQAGGTLTVSGSFPTECEMGPGTIRVEPQTIAVPPYDPGSVDFGDFAVFFELRYNGQGSNNYGGPLAVDGTGHSSLYATALDPCPERPPTFPFNVVGPTRGGLEGPGKPGKVLRGSGVSKTIFEHHSFSWTLTPKK